MWSLSKKETPVEKIFGSFFDYPDFFRADKRLFDVDLAETENAYVFKADLPGVKKEDIDITVKDGYLTVSADRKEEKKQENGDYHFYERSSGSMKRSFRIPGEIKSDAVKAEFHNGVLELTIPKAGTEGKKKIIIN